MMDGCCERGRGADKCVSNHAVLFEDGKGFWKVHLNDPIHERGVGGSCFAVVGEGEADWLVCLLFDGFGHVARFWVWVVLGEYC
jgi:hypothetical protein